jgi:hypothetical protein
MFLIGIGKTSKLINSTYMLLAYMTHYFVVEEFQKIHSIKKYSFRARSFIIDEDSRSSTYGCKK